MNVIEPTTYNEFPAISNRIHSTAGLVELDLDKKTNKNTDKQKYREYRHIISKLTKYLPGFQKAITNDLGIEDFERKLLSEVKNPESKLGIYESMDKLTIPLFNIIFCKYHKPILESYIGKQTPKALKDSIHKIQKHMEHGFQNMIQTTLSVIGLIPELFQKTYGQAIDTKTYQYLARKSINLINDFSKLHLSIFFNDMRNMIFDKPQSGINLKYLDKYFRLIKHGESNPAIEHSDLNIAGSETLVNETITKIGGSLKDKFVFGCPAYYVKVGKDKNLINVIFDWIMDILDLAYFPNWERIKENSAKSQI